MTDNSKSQTESETNADDDRFILFLSVPCAVPAEHHADLFSKVLADTIGAIAAQDNQTEKVVIGTEPEHNAELAVKLADFLRSALNLVYPEGATLPEISVADITERVAKIKAEEEAEKKKQWDALFGAFLGERPDDIYERAVAEIDRARESDRPDICGCLICVMRRQMDGVAEPEIYVNGRTPKIIGDGMSDNEWEYVDGLHQHLVNAGRLSADLPLPSARHRALSAH